MFKCKNCNHTHNEEENVYSCNCCLDDICDDCSNECESCGTLNCGSCLYECTVCDKVICKKCYDEYDKKCSCC